MYNTGKCPDEETIHPKQGKEQLILEEKTRADGFGRFITAAAGRALLRAAATPAAARCGDSCWAGVCCCLPAQARQRIARCHSQLPHLGSPAPAAAALLAPAGCLASHAPIQSGISEAKQQSSTTKSLK